MIIDDPSRQVKSTVRDIKSTLGAVQRLTYTGMNLPKAIKITAVIQLLPFLNPAESGVL